MSPKSAEKPKIVLWGAGGHARVVAELLQLEGRFDVAGLIDDVDPRRHGTAPFGVPILGGQTELPRLYADGVVHLLVAIGDCGARDRLTAQAEALGFSCPAVVHPHGFVSPSATLGSGTIVAAGAHVGPGSVIGRGVVINSNASVDHDCRVGDAAHIAPGATLGGTVDVGARVWVGLGASVIQGRRIGEDTMVGAGSVVVRDLPPHVAAWGNPARVRRDN